MRVRVRVRVREEVRIRGRACVEQGERAECEEQDDSGTMLAWARSGWGHGEVDRTTTPPHGVCVACAWRVGVRGVCARVCPRRAPLSAWKERQPLRRQPRPHPPHAPRHLPLPATFPVFPRRLRAVRVEG